MSQKYAIADLNQMTEDAFVEALGAIFEDSPIVAQRTWQARPFSSVADLHQAMLNQVEAFSADEQLQLIRSHPDLGSKAKMADASVQEQTGVGLDRLTPEEFNRLQSLNQAYTEKFGFPFIIAVRSHTKTSILDIFEQRLHNDLETERGQALHEISKISRFRLEDKVTE